jgi:hypothetical protein
MAEEQNLRVSRPDDPTPRPTTDRMLYLTDVYGFFDE